MKKTLVITTVTLAALAALLATACGQRGTIMNDDQMMDQVRSNPGMMGQMMNDPKMMQQMMDQMMKNPQMMQQMAEQMMKNPEQCARMAEHMSMNPEACRNMMQAMGSRMDPASAEAMMGHCETMMKGAGSPPASSASGAATTATSADAVQEFTVNVSGTGFSPDSLSVTKGRPVRIHFKRDDQPTCVEEVVFPELNIRRKVPASQTTTIELPPQEKGTLTFACGMDMMKGKLVVS